jgi:xylulokinase
MSFLGIDLGTSGLRVVLVNENSELLGVAEAGYSVAQPHAGWSEQDPQDWVDALHTAVAVLRQNHPAFSSLKGIGVAGHMHGATLLDKNGKVLRPCILWNDTRSHAQAAQMDADPAFREISGNIVFPGFTAPKLAWVKEHEPEIFARIAKVLLPAAFLNHHLTGGHVSDMSDSAGTAWFDLHVRDWSPALLERGGMKPKQMPELVEGCALAGTLRPELVAQWGLSGSVMVAGGAGDNAAAACGVGAVQAGQGFVSLGTSGVVLAARDEVVPAPHTSVHSFCHAVPKRWYQMSVMLAAADSLTWLGAITGQSPAALTAALGTDLRGPGPVRFAPYLSGERTPHNDANVRGGFAGLSTNTTVQDMTQAVLEGVCFGLRDGAEAIGSLGAGFEALYAIGGGAASRYWLEMLATVLNTPLHIPAGQEFGAALGAARLGIIAATGMAVEDVMTAPETSEVTLPNARLVPEYDAAYSQFRRLYPALKTLG